MNWYRADLLCRRQGGHLVEIDSLEEQKALVKESRSRKYWRTRKQFWMGLTDRKVSDDKQFHMFFSSYSYLFRKAKPLSLNHIVIVTRKREGQWVLKSSGKGPSFTHWKGYPIFFWKSDSHVLKPSKRYSRALVLNSRLHLPSQQIRTFQTISTKNLLKRFCFQGSNMQINIELVITFVSWPHPTPA